MGSIVVKPSMGMAVIALVAALAGGGTPAAACNCPKEQLIKKYGTVSQMRPPVPLPPPLPLTKSAAPAVVGG